jgi:hypothetical protein
MRSWILWSVITSTRTRVTTVIVIAVTFAAVLVSTADADPAQEAAKKVETTGDSAKKGEAPPPMPEKLGILVNDSRALPGYNLINASGNNTYLFDNEGRVVHSWKSEYPSGLAVYLLENGHLFRPAEAVNRKPGFHGPAAGGRIQEFDWDGNLVWDFEYHSEKRLPHHDAIKLPNGNALLICWEMIDEKEAVAQGRRPETVKDSQLQPDCLVEIKPTGKKTGEIVWEWRSWDHLIQERDKTKPNYGNVAEHPELFDVNYIHGDENQVSQLMATKDGRDKLRSLGYVGSAPASPNDAKTGSPKNEAEGVDAEKAANKANAAQGQPKDAQKKDQNRRPRKEPDWMHVNAVDYNADLDQIVMSSPNFCEIWIIDHSTTTEEAKGHTGGRWGKGGDILYRWGNPRAYRNGTKLDQRLFSQHNIQWIPKGLSGAGHLLVFNNGSGRTPEDYSSVDEFVPPTDKDGRYTRGKRGPFGPANALWSYSAPNKKDFYSFFISGAQRLPNGNTLINSGATGVVFEVTPEFETVWKFANPFKNIVGGPRPGGGPPKLVQVFSDFTRDSMGMKEEQRRKLDEIDKELIAKLEKALTAEQQKILAEPIEFDFSKFPAPGEFLSAFKRNKLKLTDAQTKEMQALQKDVDSKLEKVLTEDQKQGIEQAKNRFFAGGPGGPPPEGRGGAGPDGKGGGRPGGPPAGGPGGPPPGRGGPPRMGNTLFRATRYALDYPAFAGRTMKSGKTLVELQREMDADLHRVPADPEAAHR